MTFLSPFRTAVPLGDKPYKLLLVCPQNGTAVLKGSTPGCSPNIAFLATPFLSFLLGYLVCGAFGRNCLSETVDAWSSVSFRQNFLSATCVAPRLGVITQISYVGNDCMKWYDKRPFIYHRYIVDPFSTALPSVGTKHSNYK